MMSVRVKEAAAGNDVLVRLRDVHTSYGPVRAVDGVDLELLRGETLGLVGESGSGKTTLARTIVRLVDAELGEIVYDGQDITRLRGEALRRLRRRVQMIFQDPHSSLSPRLRVSYLLNEPYVINKVPQAERYSVAELLDLVELSPEQASKYPHELSGGQARRVGIARALALRPEFLVADEPTSGLDVSAAAAILNTMKELGSRLGLTYLVITHNLNVVGYIADRIAVMYLGRLAEIGSAGDVLDRPAHPYTRALLAAVSEPGVRGPSEPLVLGGDVPSPRTPPSGCRFHPRCPYAEERCRVDEPQLEAVRSGHVVACHFWRAAQEESISARVERRAAGDPSVGLHS